MHTNGESGITLVEIMVSLLVLGVVLTAFFATITSGLRSLSETRARQTASQLSTELIEDLRRLSPPEIAMLDDPASADTFATAAVVCDDGGGPKAGFFDPDGDGPLMCEELVTAPQGAITGAAPFQTTVDAIEVRTFATATDDPAVPDGTVRVTVVVDYEVAGAAEQIRRQAFFSEVSRG